MAKKRNKRGLVLSLLTGAVALVVVLRRKLRPIDSAPILPPPPPIPPSEPPRIVLPAEIMNATETPTAAPELEAETTPDPIEVPVETPAEEPLLEMEVGGAAPVSSSSEASAPVAASEPEQHVDDEDEEPIGYCVSCRTKRHMHEAHEEITDNGRRALRGICEECGSNMFRFLPNKDTTADA